METAPEWAWGWVGLSSIGFYLFLAVWVGTAIWARTKERLAVQETLRKLIDSGTTITPEVVEALRRPRPRRSAAEIRRSALKFRYWGSFLVALGIAATLWGLQYSNRPFVGIVLFLIPGLFFVAHSVITLRTQSPGEQ